MADSILAWNEVALEANRESHTKVDKREQNGPTLSSRALAIVHLAMYDAYAGVRGNPPELPPYLPGLPTAPKGASPQAAVAAAAYETLKSLFSCQKAFFDSKLAELGDPSNSGHGFGVQVAQAILADRASDPKANSDGYKPSPERFRHRPDPNNPDQCFDAPFYGAKSKGFAITARHELDAPPRGDGEYLKALRQVRAKGIMPELIGSLPKKFEKEQRLPEETLIGIFWGYDGAIRLGTPPRLYNQIVRRVAIAKGNTEDQNARLFALVNVAMGDAGILAWDQKYIHDLWRPVVGIREHDESFGPAATKANNDISDDGDPFWLPLGAPKSNILNRKFFSNAPINPPTNRSLSQTDEESILAMDKDPRRRCAECLTLNKNFTPNFPAYPSGHATFGAAALHITRLFYGVKVGNRKPDNLFDGLDLISDELNSGNAELECGTQDNEGTVRPTHRRKFAGGLWQMIIENGLSRVYLGVHWVFDAFKVKNNDEPDFSQHIGGVPLGLKIAEDIFCSGMKKSTVGSRI
ncbi:MAG: phosphatase PAP2 family protein [Kastovskya adunca ATA6-11-RM4]|jgi:vanadium chloroperoxidase|nr:phosphatase PAP2 family protein [Kastovskya adunca ATA6-11-RM4]